MAKADQQKQMVHMRLEQDLLKRLEDFRLKHRFANRTEGIRWLLEAALKAKLVPKETE
jgi:metal-responsive CopG/Arc/MetJ family transcriptional regulator